MQNFIRSIKIMSNMIVVQIEDQTAFLDYTKNYIQKNFTTSLFLRHSIMIFSRECEQIKRKIFLNWLCHIYEKKQTAQTSKILPTLWQNIHLPITLQIVAKNAVVDSSKVFVFFEGVSGVKLKAFTVRNLLISYINALFRTDDEIVILQVGADILLKPSNTHGVLQIKKLFDKKLNLAGKPINFMYDKNGFEAYLIGMQRGFEGLGASDERREYILALRVLKCSEDDNFETIRKNYISLIKKFHPDKAFGQSEQIVESYHSMFRRVQTAYEHLRQRCG